MMKNLKYKWNVDWVKIPGSEDANVNGRTHGVVVSKSGNILIFHQASPAVLTYSEEGKLLSAWGNFPGAHGMTLVEESGTEYLWLTDQNSKQVVKMTLEGQEIQSLPPPGHAAYESGNYVPTWVAVNEKRIGGNGDIWVADGYGCNLVHRYDEAGKYLSSIDGSEGEAGLFNCPHGIWIGLRNGEPLLYIADRGNRRVQVYDVESNFRKAFGADFLTSPDGFAAHGEMLIVPELVSRVTLLDADDGLITIIGENDAVNQQAGWPNNRALLQPEKFNSPHGATADAKGNIYVTEWMTGGRITKLEKLS